MEDEGWRESVARASAFLTVIDEDFRLVFINRVFPGVDDVAGTPVFAFVSADFHDVLRDAVAAAHRTGTPQHYESEAVGPDGGLSRYSSWAIALAPDATDARALTALVSIDVTSIGRIEQELDASQEILQALTRDAPDLITIVDRERRIRFANRTITGRPVAGVLGVTLDSFLRPSDLPMVQQAIARVFETGEQGSYETVFDAPHGGVALSTRLGPVFRGDHVENVTLITTDVTEQRRAEQERQRLAAQLVQAQKMESLGQLTGGIAHDFNNLLTVILGSTELIEASSEDPDTVALLASDITQAAERAAHLTQRLLAFARRQTLTPRMLSLNQLVEDETPILERTLGEQIAVQTHLAVDLWSCRADEAQLQNALLNLSINARDAMAREGTLVVTTSNVTIDDDTAPVPAGEWVSLCVGDDGVGMSPAVLQQAVEPFFTTKGHMGSGLGLSMVYGFVNQSGGHLNIDSVEGEGTSATLYLPRHQGEGTPLPPRRRQAELPVGDGELVLVVEDDPRVMRATDALIRSLGYRTLLATDAGEALSTLASVDSVDLVFSDVVLPGMSGAELRVQILERYPGLGVVLTSGFATDILSDPQHAEAALLPKPFSRTQLATALQTALDEKGTD